MQVASNSSQILNKNPLGYGLSVNLGTGSRVLAPKDPLECEVEYGTLNDDKLEGLMSKVRILKDASGFQLVSNGMRLIHSTLCIGDDRHRRRSSSIKYGIGQYFQYPDLTH
jgi:hypothetical protein